MNAAINITTTTTTFTSKTTITTATDTTNVYIKSYHKVRKGHIHNGVENICNTSHETITAVVCHDIYKDVFVSQVM